MSANQIDPQFRAMAESIAALVIKHLSAENVPIAPRYLDSHKAAAYLGLDHKTLYGMRYEPGPYRGPKFVKVGRVYRYPVDELDAWMRRLASEA